MVSLARSSLIYDWHRYAAAVFAITFAGLLVAVQLALLLGLFGTVSVAIDQSSADLWIGYPKTQSVDLGRPLAPGTAVNAWKHPAVRRVEPMGFALGDLRGFNGVAVMVFIYGIDPAPQGLAFARKLSLEQRRLLDEPGTVIIDVADQRKLAVEVGSLIEINGKRARIAGFVEGIRAVGTVSVLTSRTSLRRYSPEFGTPATYQLISLRNGADPIRVAGEIGDTGPIVRYGVWTAQDFSTRSQIYWLLESGVGIGTGFASALALLVGVVITSQTLGAAVLASLKEFAALRALGISNTSLRKVVLEQSVWLGLIGLALTGLLTTATAWVGHAGHVAMSFPWWLPVGTSVIILAVALGSGILALRPLYQADPANLLR